MKAPRKRRSTVKESEIQRAILDYLRLKKIPCWRINVIGIPTQTGFRPNHEMRGVADIHAILNINGFGLCLWLEVKTPKGKQTQHQKNFQNEVTQAGGIYKVVRSVDDVESLLKITTYKLRKELNHES